MMLTEAKKFHAYARECLQLAEEARLEQFGEQRL
jgi:hypothetical protein